MNFAQIGKMTTPPFSGDRPTFGIGVILVVGPLSPVLAGLLLVVLLVVVIFVVLPTAESASHLETGSPHENHVIMRRTQSLFSLSLSIAFSVTKLTISSDKCSVLFAAHLFY